MLPHVGVAILHGCLAAAFVEVLMRAWHVQAPAQRLALRGLALLAPLALPALFAVAAPFRSTDAFAIRWAIYAGARWDAVRFAGVGLSVLTIGILASAGALLYLRDAVPFLADRIRPREPDEPLPSSHPACRRVEALIAALPAACRKTVPALRVLQAGGAMLYCSGITTPVMTVSTGTLDRLDDQELSAALAHEFEHVRLRDPALGWILMLVRTLQFFNPATQIVGRQIVQEIEHRSDRHVARFDMAAPLARAIARLSHAFPSHTDLSSGSSAPPASAALAERAASRATEIRCERLLAPTRIDARGVGTLRLVLAASGLTALLFLVV